MKRHKGPISVAALTLAAGIHLVGCATADNSEIVTFTDEHGRACTAVAVKDGDDGDYEVSSIDCDYPPAGRTPGPVRHRELPRK